MIEPMIEEEIPNHIQNEAIIIYKKVVSLMNGYDNLLTVDAIGGNNRFNAIDIDTVVNFNKATENCIIS